MQRLLFLSITSSLLLLACEGCGGDECGPGAAPDFGLLASSADVTLNYGNLTSGANNDCPDPMAPSGVVSLTINGTQMGAASLLTFCIPRPDQLAGGVQLGSGFRIIDLNGEANGCTFKYEGAPVTGSAQAFGLCDNGKDAAGYSLSIDGFVTLKRTCPTTSDTVSLSLKGEVKVKSLD